jgi:hypothetical protein
MRDGTAAWNTRLVAHHDLNGHGDGMQVIFIRSSASDATARPG